MIKDFINQNIGSELILKSGNYTYRVLSDWAQLPDEYKDLPVSSSCCDNKGHVYVSVRTAGIAVLVFDEDGCFVKALKNDTLLRPHGIFYTERDTLFLADDDGHCIYELNLDGEIIRKIGSGIASDTGYNRKIIDQMRADGRLAPDAVITKIQRAGIVTDTIERVAGPFNHPTQMIEANDGRLFAADGYGNARIHCFDKEGNLLYSFGEKGYGEGGIRIVHGICLDSQSRIWVADRENSRVHVFTNEGKLITTSTCFKHRPAEVWYHDGKVFVGEVDGGISIVDMNFNVVSKLGYEFPILRCHGISGDDKENLYVSTLRFNAKNIIKLERI